ncbi:MAG: phage tail assembly protein [Burkholderiales bacterium]|nr:phage tail assembly protein [Burkholderiales bacterium]
MALTVVKTLPKPWKVGAQIASDIEVREPLVKDLTAAEQEANPTWGPNAFQVALACQTVVRAGRFTGPFVPGHFNEMGVANFKVVQKALQEAELLGEDMPADADRQS